MMIKKKKSVVKKSTPKKGKNRKSMPKKAARIKTAAKKNKTDLVLGAILLINDAGDTLKKLKQLSKSSEAVTIDASNVEMIDTASFQLLLAFVVTMNKKNVALNWKKPSYEFLERASILDLTDDLRLGNIQGP